MSRRGHTPTLCDGRVVWLGVLLFGFLPRDLPRLALPREIWNLYQQSSRSEQESSRRDESAGRSTRYSAEAQGAAPGPAGQGEAVKLLPLYRVRVRGPGSGPGLSLTREWPRGHGSLENFVTT